MDEGWGLQAMFRYALRTDAVLLHGIVEV